MVPVRSDHYLDLIQSADESLKDALRRTMLDQENMFRNQVQELHRVYQMQMLLMNNSGLKEIATTQSTNYSKHVYGQMWSQRPLDFKLPAGYYMNCINENFLVKGNGLGTQEKPILVESYFQDEADFSTEEVKLSLSIGGDASFSNGRKSWKEKVTSSSSPHIIDLEESTRIVFSGAALLDLNRPPCDESSIHLKDDNVVPSLEDASTDTLDGFVGVFQESASPDSSSCRTPNDNHSNQLSTLLQQQTPTSVLTALNSSDNSTNSGSNACSMDLESCCKAPSENSGDQECLTSNSLHKKGELGTNLGCRNSKAEEGMLTSNVCRKEDTMEEADIDRSPVSIEPVDYAADPSSARETGAYLENSFPLVDSLQSSESPQHAYFGNGDYISRSSANRNEGSALDDALIRKGAVSLLYFMSEISEAGENHSVGEARAGNEIEKGKLDNEPERSLDSFESAVLKLEESKIDDYNDVSSNTYEVKDMDEKDSPIKLRRGRRMKDFQKDILPSLASLSRHEICEDVRLLEGVIRSREYKRLRSKMGSEQNWFTPVRSRRSRLNYIGRRCYN